MEYKKILEWVKSENIRGYELETDRCVADVIGNFLNSNKEAINYTRCCTELKDKELPTFEEWKKANYIHYDKNLFVRKQEGLKDLDQLFKKYDKEILNL